MSVAIHRGRRQRTRPRAAPTSRSAPRAPRPPAVRPPFEARIASLRRLIQSHDLGFFLVTNPLDVAYLTGFLGGDSYLLVAPDTLTVISDFRYEEELKPIRRLASIHIRKGGMAAAVAEVFAARRVGRCGIQKEHLTVAEAEGLAAALGEGGPRLVPKGGLIAGLREIKDATEVECIRHAIRIQEAALLAALPFIKPGETELAVAARLEAEMKTRGSIQPGFTTIVAARANGSLPHYRPHAVKLGAGRPVLIDWGAVFLGYHGDMTRTFSLGRWPAKVREIYSIVLDAQEKAAAALAPGRSTREIDAIARDHITRAGYGPQFGHGLGHGLGFNGHEDPRLSHMTPDTQLRPGHVVTVEPGIYLPGVGGVRIEDDYLVTRTGSQRLCTLPKDLAWATL